LGFDSTTLERYDASGIIHSCDILTNAVMLQNVVDMTKIIAQLSVVTLVGITIIQRVIVGAGLLETAILLRFEQCAAKVAGTVLRGRGRRNAILLPT